MVRLLRQMAALLLALGGMWAFAAPTATHSAEVCWAALNPAEPVVTALRQVRQWDCAGRFQTLGQERVAVRLAVTGSTSTQTHSLVAGTGQFERLTMIAVDPQGAMRMAAWQASRAEPVVGEPKFSVPLPRLEQPKTYYAVFDNSGSRYIAQQASLIDEPVPGSANNGSAALLLAVLVGMLAIPLLLDLGVYGALREPFFLWHAALIGNFILLLLCWSGLVVQFIGIGVAAWHKLTMVSLALNGAAACLFNRSYNIELRRGARLSRALLAGAIYCAVWSGLQAVGVFDGSMLLGTLYSVGLVPILLLLCVNMGLIIWAGDRMMRLQFLGWLPLALFFGIRFISDTFSIAVPYNAMPLLYTGVLILSVLSASGVILRFSDMRRERDLAIARANVMGGLAERDPLTGLFNRRAIDNRFPSLRAKGYDHFALVDLDHFKNINDVSGHSAGDQVLEVTARVLASDPDNIAVRLGGEEFLVLLRGANSADRAEKLRRMLSVRVAREVDGLERIVTASMGLLALSADCPKSLDFATVYSRADGLLYTAKREGRNRTKAASWGAKAAPAAGEPMPPTEEHTGQPAVA